MIYDVTHLTRYSYGGSVAVNACALRLWPRQEEGQSVLAARIDLEGWARQLSDGSRAVIFLPLNA